jgi:hypothetical protein
MPSQIRRFVVVACVALCAAAVHAQGEPAGELVEIGRWGPSFGPEPPSPIAAPIDWDRQDAIARNDPATRNYLAAHPGWRVVFDLETSLPWRAFGPGYPVVRPGASEAEIREAATAVAAELHATFGLPGDVPVLRAVARAGRLWFCTAEQRVGGVRVDDAGLMLRIDGEGRLVMWGGRFVSTASRYDAPRFESADAKLFATSELRAEGLVAPSTRLDYASAELVLHASVLAPRTSAALSWKLRIAADAPHAEWLVYVDARTGAIREYWNDVRYCGVDHAPSRPRLPVKKARAVFTATATGTVHENVLPNQTPVSMPIQDCTYVVNEPGFGVSILTTDAAGQFFFSGGGGSATVTSGLDGLWITTNNVASGGAQANFASTVPNGAGALAATWTDTVSTLEERDAFFFGTRARNNILLHNPTETLFNNPIVANLNVTGTCNAFYSPSAQTINFYPPGGGCINTAFSDTVVEHEYGHHVSTVIWNFHGFSVPGHLGEGYSDCQAGSCEDQSQVGLGFSGPGTIIRDMNNTCQYPSSCGTGVHARGRIIGGAYWHTRVEFVNAYGAGGKAIMDGYLYQHLHGAPLTETDACLDFLLLNDDDANVLNGTPDIAKFFYGFNTLHSIPFPLPPATVSHQPIVHNENQLHPYEVRATAASLFTTGIVTAMLHYAVDDGPTTSVPMTFVGSEWKGSIPTQTSQKRVKYWFTFVDALGASILHPTNAPLDAFAIRTYRPATFYSEMFDGPTSWVSAGTGQNDWQTGAPGNPNHAYDPPSAFQGTGCTGNDLSIGNFNGNYQNNVDNSLTSPTINCTGRTGVTLSYRRWLTVEDGLYDVASIELSVGGGPFVAVWQNAVGTGNHIDKSWVKHEVRLAAADNQAAVQIRFRLDTDGGVVFGGWTVDDLRLDAFPPTSTMTLSGSTAPGATATVSLAGNPGDTFAWAADVATPGYYVPSLGTIAFDPFGPGFLLILPPGVAFAPPGGVLNFPFTVPPGLTGTTIYMQSVVVPPTGLQTISNVLPVTFL